MENYIGEIVVGGLALLGTIISGHMTNQKTIYRIDQLEKKQDKHNGLIERMIIVEQSTKSAHHRIDDLEK